MDDLRNRRHLKTKDAVIQALLDDPNVVHLPPYIIIHEKGEKHVSIHILIEEKNGIRKVFENRTKREVDERISSPAPLSTPSNHGTNIESSREA